MYIKNLLIYLFLIFPTFILSQNKLKFYSETVNDTVTSYLDNEDFFPVTIKFSDQISIDNMQILQDLGLTFVVPENSYRYPIKKLVHKDKSKPYHYNSSGYKAYPGNILNKEYDKSYIYDLPFKRKSSFILEKSKHADAKRYNGAVHFDLPTGTTVTAAREGKIILMKMDSNINCNSIDCEKDANYIGILHSDGTIAQYGHLTYNSNLIQLGDKVEKGQSIALSGNTGWSNKPHLYFHCFLPTEEGPEYFKMQFKIGDGKKSGFLKEKQNYSKNY